MGYLGGVNCSLFCAYAAMLYPQAAPAVVLYHCFRIFAEWKWPKPVLIRDVGFTNDPFVIAQMPKMVSVNSAIEIDITGQVVSDSIGPKIFSGFGGQVDFIYGASRSKGGKAIIAMPSTTKKGDSKIVGFLKQGAGVVTTRAHVRYIVTEYGIADLYGKSLRERARAMIDIAHPDHREELEKIAREKLGLRL